MGENRDRYSPAGYSGIWICLALRNTGGKLVTYEIDARRATLARENFERAGVEKMVTLVEGDAHQEVLKLTGPIDLLFLDADAQLEDDVLARALREADSSEAAHLCLLPQLRDQTLPGLWITLTMALGLAQQAAGLEADRSSAYFGVGAFTLIRREVYREVGGHEALRMQVIEDVMLARRVREAGHG